MALKCGGIILIETNRKRFSILCRTITKFTYDPFDIALNENVFSNLYSINLSTLNSSQQY